MKASIAFTRFAEELHEIRDRAQILNSELNNAEAQSGSRDRPWGFRELGTGR